MNSAFGDKRMLVVMSAVVFVIELFCDERYRFFQIGFADEDVDVAAGSHKAFGIEALDDCAFERDEINRVFFQKRIDSVFFKVELLATEYCNDFLL